MKIEKSARPLVSVLIATYNQEEYIAQTLDSVLMQECSFDFEILVGDDASTDGTRSILLDYREKHPQQIVLCLNEKNKGLLDNYFDLFLKSRGTYLADCGGDDYWLTKNRLEQQVRLLEEKPFLSMVAGNWSVYRSKTAQMVEHVAALHADWFHSDLFGKEAVACYLNDTRIPRVVLSTTCFRRDWAMEAYQLHPELFRSKELTCEDLPLTLCLLMKGPMYVCCEDFLVYRELKNSISHSENLNDYVSGFAFRTFKQTVVLAKTLGLASDEIKPYTKKWVGNFVLHAFMEKDHKTMKEMSAFAHKQDLPFGGKLRFLYVCMSLSGIYGLSRWLYLKVRNSRKKNEG